ncbi:unnamed protein product, partial [marine sediment metagenome]
RRAHGRLHPEFVKWVEEATKDLFRIETKRVPEVTLVHGTEITSPSVTYNTAETQKPKGEEGVSKNPW